MMREGVEETMQEQGKAPSFEAQEPVAEQMQVGVGTEAEVKESGYPEGGTKAWLVVFGAWCAMIPAMGLLNTIGVLQAWILEHQLSDYSDSAVGWIISTYAFCLYIGGAQVGL